MEITNEIKAKLFAQYLGHRVELDNGGSKVRNRILCAVGGINDEAEYVKLRMGNFAHAVLIRSNSAKLILKPLSEVTDEDAMAVAKLQLMPFIPFEETKTYLLNESVLKYTYMMNVSQYEYLKSKGYDLPQYLLDGKTLKDIGLAVYENDN